MRLSTTTLGCFKWELPAVLANVAGYGFDGIDFRGLKGTLKLWRLPEFSTGMADTAARIRDHGLTVTCISSGILLSDARPKRMAEHDEELVRSAELCAALGCGQIRVFGGSLGLADGATEADRDRVVDVVAERACVLADRAARIGPVDILIETHDAWTSSQYMAAVLSRADRPDVACCWDLKHTYWVGKETPDTTWGRIGQWVRNTHWKDVRRFRGTKEDFGRDLSESGLLCPVGTGIAPLADCHDLLTAAGYDGWFTLEWEKHWHPHIEDPEVAFPGFVRYLRELEAR
ncbi:MAG: sugar phosphate isomerase/epimerase [Victivallales bacterium]|nr:sugar phosphate isomerase/epimerase [Victivallales bacterium]